MVQKITRTFAVFASFMLVSIVSFAQNASVKGMLTDSDGKALYNASVTVEGKSKGAMSNDKGFYEIKGLTAGSYTLIYRFMGMETIKETVVLQENQALIKDVTLQSKAKDEDEVVVIGYGTSRTKDLTGAAITSANVLDELGAVVDAIPTAVYGSEDLHIYAASDVVRAYTRALGGFQSGGQGANGYENKGNNQSLGSLFFDGIPVVAIRGAAAGTIIAAEKSNLFFGTGLLNDLNEVRVIDMAENDGSQNVRIVMRFTAGVQYAQVTDIVYRKTV
jgi:hypothetical protein